MSHVPVMHTASMLVTDRCTSDSDGHVRRTHLCHRPQQQSLSETAKATCLDRSWTLPIWKSRGRQRSAKSCKPYELSSAMLDGDGSAARARLMLICMIGICALAQSLKKLADRMSCAA